MPHGHLVMTNGEEVVDEIVEDVPIAVDDEAEEVESIAEMEMGGGALVPEEEEALGHRRDRPEGISEGFSQCCREAALAEAGSHRTDAIFCPHFGDMRTCIHRINRSTLGTMGLLGAALPAASGAGTACGVRCGPLAHTGRARQWPVGRWAFCAD